MEPGSLVVTRHDPPAAAFPTACILDVFVHRASRSEVIAHIDRLIQSQTPHQIVTVNLDFLRLARTDAEFRRVLNQAALAVPDGMPLVWASRLLNAPMRERVTGVDIMQDCAALAAQRGYGIFLLGSGPGIAARAADELVRQHPGLRIAGTYTPPFGPFSDQESAQMVAAVRRAGPDLLFVAFGAPRQEVWIDRYKLQLGVPVCMGVGGSFDVLAGRVSRAPSWMQRSGLEWAHRLIQEPSRLWYRYLVADLPIFARLCTESVSRRARQPSPDLPRFSPR